MITLNELIYTIVQKCTETACFGGRHRIQLNLVEQFLNKLKSAGAELHFYEGTMVGKGKPAACLDKAKRLENNYNASINMLYTMTSEQKDKSFPEYRSTLAFDMKAIAEQYGKYYLLTLSKSKLMAEIARSGNNILALMARDTAFLVFDLGNAQYWSCATDDLNLDRFETVRFDQSALLRFLGLSPLQLRYLASILSAIHRDDETINNIATSIMNYVPNNLFKYIKLIRDISKFVGDHISTTEDLSFSDIARMLLERPDDAFAEAFADNIKIKFARFNSEDVDDQIRDRGAFQNALRHNYFLSRLWNNRLIDINCDFLNLSPSPEGGKTCAEVLMIAYTRAMGVFFHHFPKLERHFMVKVSIV